jgi:two-component system NarL family response regulator
VSERYRYLPIVTIQKAFHRIRTAARFISSDEVASKLFSEFRYKETVMSKNARNTSVRPQIPQLWKGPDRRAALAVVQAMPKNGGDASLRRQSEQASTSSTQSSLRQREKLKLLLADNHPVVLAGVASMLSGRSDISIVEQARNGREAVEKFLQLRPDVGLFEVRMPVMDGIEAVAEIRAHLPGARLLMFTTCQSEEDVYRAVRAGAQGYVFKDAPTEELVQSICAVGTGQQWIPLIAAARLASRIADRELTVREKEVLIAITSGKSNKEIGVALNISEATVKVHVTHILEKLKASGRTEAIRLAVQRGLVYLDAPAPAAA